MEFRVLGPLAVEDQGRVVPLGGPSERHLLALLLCLANEPVPVERIIDELWGDEPPVSAKNVIQQYVSHIRRALGDGHAERLTTDPGGYVLHVEDDEVDWHRFQKIVARAHDVRVPAQAGELLTEALNVWHGPPFAGAGHGPTVDAERTRLEEARLTAIEDRIDCDLELGRHRELIPELESLQAQHPDRERLLGQLMLALYRSDRQPEALRHYEHYRQRLGEETGLEPSASLAELEGKILTSDPDLGQSGGAGLPATNLPQRVSSFVGRRKEIAAARVRMLENRLVTLVGVGGIGKTSLALQAATELQLTFPDGVWLIDLASLGDASLIGGTAAGVLGVGVGPRQDPTQAVVDHLRNQEALIVLDNCEHLVDGAAEFAKTMLQCCAGVRVLATSRMALGVPGEAIMRVPSLQVPDQTETEAEEIAASEAATLFVDRARLLRPEFELDDSNAGAVAEICCRLDGIPLAIELAAARLGTMPVHQIAAHVEDRYHLLTKGARTAPHRHQTLRAMVDWSHDLLDEKERVVLRRLGVFAGSFTLDAANYVCGYDPLDEAIVEEALEQLVEASLVDPPVVESGRFGMLATIREYARNHLEVSDETAVAMRRLAKHLNEHGPASEEGYPVSDYESWYAWRDAERANFRQVLAWALAARDPDVAASTAIEFRNYLSVGNLADETIALVDSVLELLGDETSHRHLRLSTFSVVNEMFLGDRRKARAMAEALEDQAKTLGEKGVAGFALQVQSMDEIRNGNLEGALEINAQAIAHLRAADDIRAPDQMWLRSFFLTRLGRFAEARAVLDETLAIARAMGERYDNRFAESFRNIGTAVVAAYEGNAAEAERLLDLEDEYIHHLGPDDLIGYSWGRWQVAFLNDDPAQAEVAAKELDDVTPASATPDRRRDIAYMRALPALALRGPEAARPFLRDAVQLAHEDGGVIDLAEITTLVAESALRVADPDVAAVLYAAASSILDPSRIVVAPWQRTRIDEAIDAVRSLTDPARFRVLWEQGTAMSIDEMVDYALQYLGMDPA